MLESPTHTRIRFYVMFCLLAARCRAPFYSIFISIYDVCDLCNREPEWIIKYDPRCRCLTHRTVFLFLLVFHTPININPKLFGASYSSPATQQFAYMISVRLICCLALAVARASDWARVEQIRAICFAPRNALEECPRHPMVAATCSDPSLGSDTIFIVDCACICFHANDITRS